MGKSTPESKLITDQTSAFFRSVQRNQLDEVKEILTILKETNHFKNVNVVDSLRVKKSGDTALHICASNGFIDIIRFMIESEGANLEQINLDGKTALHDAAQFSQPEVLEFLLAKGANVNVVKRADWTPLMLACTKLNLEVVKSLVNAQANLSFINKDGWNCLHLSAREGNADIVGYLLQSCQEPDAKFALLNKRSRNGRKPIHMAVMHGHLEVTKLLASQNSKEHVNDEDNCGSSPIMDACRGGHQDIVEFLIDEMQIDPTSLNKNGVGLLHVSAEANQPEMVKFLVEKYKLDVNQQSKLLSFTPLHSAGREGNTQVIDVLLKLGACYNIKDEKGRTPSDISEEFHKTEAYTLLNAKMGPEL